MKLVILGCSGQVGWELQRALAPLGEVLALDARSTVFAADFTDPAAVADTVRRVRPDVVVNAAAHTAVDKAESEPGLARLINATTPGAIAQVCAELGSLLVHYSTDYVFDGRGDAARDETEATGPLGVYGQTKLEGEQLIQQSGCRHLVFRTSWVYAARGANFARTMLRLGAEREQLKVIDDQVGAPTGADLLADVSAHAIRQTLARPELCGLYHCVAAGETSWYEYARFVFDTAREAGQPLRLRELLAIPTSEYPTPAARPLNSRLSTQKLRDAFGLNLPHWQQGVTRMLNEII